MRRHSFIAFFSALSVAVAAQTTHELTNAGSTFSPPVINMVAGDSIHLVLNGPHTCTQVDEATWQANDNTSNGGFDYPNGEHTFALDVPGTYYYVCANHANMGMKGQFIVAISSGVQERNGAMLPQLFPNPATKRVTVPGSQAGRSVQVFDLKGRSVLEVPVTSSNVLDVSMLEVGTYLVAVKDEQGRRLARERLVITH